MNEQKKQSLVKRTLTALSNKFFAAFVVDESGMSPVETAMFMSYTAGYNAMDAGYMLEHYARAKVYSEDSGN